MAKTNMADLFKQAQKMQDEMNRVQESLEEMTVDGAAGGGVVKATVNGRLKLLGVQIDPEVVQSDDKEMLEDLIAAAVNQALEKAQEMAQQEMQKVAGGMLGNLPLGGMKIPGLTL